MLLQEGRSGAGISPSLAEGWRLERLTPPSRLFGANGLRTGPDGRIYIAQVTGSQISALDIETGRLETISPKGGDIIAPDDVAFDPRGNLYATEVMDGRVSVRGTDGRTRVLRDDVPSANGITVHQGRLFIGECREGGRLLELDLGGGPPRVLLENVPSPNAMEVGPDGLLYFPVMGANEIWRIDLDGGAPERVATGPRRARFGEVRLGGPHRLDPGAQRPGVAHRPAHRRADSAGRSEPRPGQLDLRRGPAVRLEFHRRDHRNPGRRQDFDRVAGRAELAAGSGRRPRRQPLHRRRHLLLRSCCPIAHCRPWACCSRPGYPGFLRGLAPAGPGEFVVTTSGGQVSRYRPAQQRNRGAGRRIRSALRGGGRPPTVPSWPPNSGPDGCCRSAPGGVDVIASGLHDPVGVAIAPDGACLVSEAGAGRVVRT